MDYLSDAAVFCKVVEQGSLTAAADALQLSKAVVSKYVKRLETRLARHVDNLYFVPTRVLADQRAHDFEESRGVVTQIAGSTGAA